jgi:EPS-associated MarR family transcriptional regulator
LLTFEQSAAGSKAAAAHALRAVMASKHPEQVEDLHFRVLKLIQDQPDMSQRELAQRLGVSNGKLHYCMKALIEKGLVKLGNFANSKHHLGYAYLLTPKGMARKANMTSDFLKRKMKEYEALQAEIAALQAEIGRGAKGEASHKRMNSK